MPKPHPLPPELPPAFTYAEGLASGASARRLRASDVATPFRGARARFMTSDVYSLARAYSPLLSSDQYFSHLTAAQLLGLRMPEGYLPQALHVTSVFPVRAVRRLGIVGHQSQNAQFVVARGLRMSTPLQAWLECSELLDLDDLVIMGDTLVRRRSPFVTVDQLAAAAKAHRGQRGSRTIAGAIVLIREHTDSARETMLRLALGEQVFRSPKSMAQSSTHSDRPLHTVIWSTARIAPLSSTTVATIERTIGSSPSTSSGSTN